MQGYIKVVQGTAQSKHRARAKADEKEREFDPKATATEQDFFQENYKAPTSKKKAIYKKKDKPEREETAFPDHEPSATESSESDVDFSD
eukprot:2778464-Alexandrium_andersonii.AAC.1